MSFLREEKMMPAVYGDDNEGRAARGADAIDHYAPRAGYDFAVQDIDGDWRAAAVDLMSDVLHALEAHGLSAEDAHNMAWRHFLDETTEARREREETRR
jgi:hypothetical protein